MDTIAQQDAELQSLRSRVLAALTSIEAAIKDPNRGDASALGEISYIVADLRRSTENERNPPHHE